MKNALTLLAILSSSASFADYKCTIQEKINSSGTESFKTRYTKSVIDGELSGISGLRIASKTGLKDDVSYRFDYILDAGIMCHTENECKLLGYLRTTVSDKYPGKDWKFLIQLPKNQIVNIYGDQEQVFNFLNDNMSTTLKISCLKN